MDKAVLEYYARREKRLNKRGIKPSSRFDANPKVAYGIAQSMGIDTEGMSPAEVWEAIGKEGGGKGSLKTSGRISAKAKSGNKINSNSSASNNNAKKYVGNNTNGGKRVVGGYERKNEFKNGYRNTEVGKEERNDLYSGVTMRENTNDAGEWTEEREALHSKIIDDTFKGVKKAEGKPVAMFLGGGPASGKSYVAEKMQKETGILPDDQAVKVDPDAVKKKLPEFDPDSPSPVHEESSALAKRISSIAQENGYNVTIDGTGDGSVEKMRKKIKEARDNGMTVKGTYVFVPTEIALQRNFARDRTVNEKMLIKTHAKISSILPEIAKDFDEVRLYSNAEKGKKPKLIAYGGGGKDLTIVDKGLYKQFLDNANYQFDKDRISEIKRMPESRKKTKRYKKQ